MVKIKLFPKPAHFFLVTFLLIINVNYSSPGAEPMPNSSKECAICHIRWVQAFDRNKPENQENPMQDVLERQAGSGDMCLSCHDGSVTDSRFEIWSTNHHTTDSKPPESINIPTNIFPLDAQGRMTCATCHTAHAVPESSDLKTVIFLRQPNIDSSLCLSCHSEHAQKNDFQHPLEKVDYPIPLEIIDAGGKTSDDGETIICQTCHEPHGARNSWMLVLPPSKLCIACHTDKNPESNPPAGAPMHHIGQTFPNFNPPASLLEEKATFGPNGELTCLSCHRLHDASGAWPLLIRKNENSSLCLDCHKNEKAVIGTLHDLRLSSPETVNAKGQTASQSGPCGACHRIHGWARVVPDANRPHSSGCMECHESGGPGSVERLYVDSHTVGKPIPEDMKTILPLDKKTHSIGCLTCHDPHIPSMLANTSEAAQATQLNLSDPETNNSMNQVHSNVQAPLSFLRYKGSELCSLCHKNLLDLPGQPHNPETFESSVCEALAINSSIGACRVCHLIHNAKGPYLWSRKPITDAGNITDLCGTCHEDKLDIQNSIHDPNSAQWSQKLGYKSKGSCIDCHLIHDPNEEGGIWSAIKTEDDTSQSCETCHQDNGPAESMKTEHMGKIVGTDVNDIPVNMKLSQDRRILCTTCHDIHQNEQNPKLLVESLPDLCGTCHQNRLGIQNSIHDPNTAEWAKNLGFVSKGSCIDCHSIHDRKNSSDVWAIIGIRDDKEKTCENCHHEGSPGSAMETPHLGKNLKAELENLPSEMNVGPDNKIVCTSCHDIHKNKQEKKLLVIPSQDSDLCIACHQEEKNIVNTKHDMRVSAPDVHNVLGEISSESGPCGSCHLVHPESDTDTVWAQKILSKNTYGNELCTSCHREEQNAVANIPKYTNHPVVTLLNHTPSGQADYMPTFDTQGKTSQTGSISCLTCHEPHSAVSSSNTANLFTFNNDMFLRQNASNGICIDCHGSEALWRFLYYHKENRNPYIENK